MQMIALHLFNIDIALNRSAGRCNRPVDVNHKNSRQDRSHVRTACQDSSMFMILGYSRAAIQIICLWLNDQKTDAATEVSRDTNANHTMLYWHSMHRYNIFNVKLTTFTCKASFLAQCELIAPKSEHLEW